jgi:hypothetical protein
MLKKNIQHQVAGATVTLLGKGGQGVLVTNGFILTAAHCISANYDGRMAQGDYFIEEIETTRGKLKATPYAVEPVSDIAVLGPLDDQEFCDEVTQFEDFCEKTKPLRLCLKKFAWRFEFPIWIYTHKKTWIKGKAENFSIKKNPSTISIKTDKNIEGGTSGSPIINEQGELVAVVSTGGGNLEVDHDGNFYMPISREGNSPLPKFALPVWLYQEITAIDPYLLYHRISKKRREEILKKDSGERR